MIFVYVILGFGAIASIFLLYFWYKIITKPKNTAHRDTNTTPTQTPVVDETPILFPKSKEYEEPLGI